jgi:hypothetical protein
MRAWIAVLFAAFFTVAALGPTGPALAAPTCLDAAGRTVRCGTAGALPVGTELSPAQVEARRMAGDGGLSPTAMLGLALVLGGLFALFALLPDFDGFGAGGGEAKDE